MGFVPFTGAVLAGGRSTRMGTDKAFVAWRGRPLVAVAVAALAGTGVQRVLAIGGDGPRLAALDVGVRVEPVADRYPGEGPLGGIVTALLAAGDDIVVVLSCDLLRVEPAAVDAVLDALGEADAAVPMIDGRPQPMLAAYRPSCLGPFSAALDAGERAPRRALDGISVAWVSLADRRWADNANRPEDLRARRGP